MYIPILMYHDVCREDESLCNSKGHSMVPMYNITSLQFENQLRVLFDMGFECPPLSDIASLDPLKKYAILTFDDGLIGNFIHVLPLLKKYGFFGNFFVTTGSIGSERFMSWDQLGVLVKEGMYVQSHTVSHRSLEILQNNEIQTELSLSKKALEEKLGVQVDGISFPHGSYKKEIIGMAIDEGYKILCTSDVTWETHRSFHKKTVMLGRIAITRKTDITSFSKIVQGSTFEYCKQKSIKSSKNFIKRTIGVQAYRKIYRYIFDIRSPTG